MRLIFLTMILTGCASAPTLENADCKNCVFTVIQDPSGVLEIRAPDVSGFDRVSPLPQNIGVECEYKTIAILRNEDDAGVVRETHHEEPEVSAAAKRECLESLQKLLIGKGFRLVSPTLPQIERWVFRFEETHKDFVDSNTLGNKLFHPHERVKMWGTLTRFKSGKPFSHIVVDGYSQYQKQTIRLDAKSAALIAGARLEPSLNERLMRSLITTAVQDPKAGSAELN